MINQTTLSNKIHDFWFEPAPATRLAMLRILVGAFVVWYLLMQQDTFLRVAHTDPSFFAPVGIVFGHPVAPEMFSWLYRGTIIAALCFTLGVFHRVTGPLSSIATLWMLCYQDSWSMIFHSMNLVALHGLILGFTPSADALSFDSFLRNAGKSSSDATEQISWRYGWPIRLICALTVSTYFITAVAKIAGPLGVGWVSGRALRSQMAVDQLRKELLGVAPNPVSYAIYDWLPLFTLLAIGSFIMEFFAPVALLNRRIGYVWAVNTFLMHWGILLVMRITFEYQLTGMIFASFFPVERLLELPRKLWRRRVAGIGASSSESAAGLAVPESVPRATLYYDGECGLCDRFVQFVLRHDRSEYFQFATLQSEAGREQLSRLGLSENDLRTVVLIEEGNAYVRSAATLRVCRRLAGFWPLLYAFIVIPRPLRDAAYALVARNRKRWLKTPAACPVMPPEWRRRFIA
jgi:predicted DCC family thiol-disulfide oxidoreductase YuxK